MAPTLRVYATRWATPTGPTGRGTCAACGEATTIRYRTAQKATEIEASFVPEDISVSDF
jgi:hypothetical protein